MGLARLRLSGTGFSVQLLADDNLAVTAAAAHLFEHVSDEAAFGPVVLVELVCMGHTFRIFEPAECALCVSAV